MSNNWDSTKNKRLIMRNKWNNMNKINDLKGKKSKDRLDKELKEKQEKELKDKNRKKDRDRKDKQNKGNKGKKKNAKSKRKLHLEGWCQRCRQNKAQWNCHHCQVLSKNQQRRHYLTKKTNKLNLNRKNQFKKPQKRTIFLTMTMNNLPLSQLKKLKRESLEKKKLYLMMTKMKDSVSSQKKNQLRATNMSLNKEVHLFRSLKRKAYLTMTNKMIFLLPPKSRKKWSLQFDKSQSKPKEVCFLDKKNKPQWSQRKLLSLLGPNLLLKTKRKHCYLTMNRTISNLQKKLNLQSRKLKYLLLSRKRKEDFLMMTNLNQFHRSLLQLQFNKFQKKLQCRFQHQRKRVSLTMMKDNHFPKRQNLRLNLLKRKELSLTMISQTTSLQLLKRPLSQLKNQNQIYLRTMMTIFQWLKSQRNLQLKTKRNYSTILIENGNQLYKNIIWTNYWSSCCPLFLAIYLCCDPIFYLFYACYHLFDEAY